MQLKKVEPGNFCWAELATKDQPGAKKFYSTVFGWKAHDELLGGGVSYTMLSKGDKNVAAIYNDTDPEVHPHWGLYIAVADVLKSTSKVKSLGGAVIAEPFDVMQAGSMSVIQDPSGAVVCLWQAKLHQGFEVIDEPGSTCWYELYTRDTAAATKFYAGLFGWTTKVSAHMDTYTEWLRDGKSIGGMMEISKDWGEYPPNWTVYFQIADVNATVAAVEANGGKLTMPIHPIPGTGQFAMMSDPQGAGFAVIELNQQG